MIPHVQVAIQTLSQRILNHVLPTISSTYVMSDSAMLAMLLSALAEEAESGVANRLIDIGAMEDIFQTAKRAGFEIDHVCCEAKNFLAQEMTLTKVNERHDVLTKNLIALHEKVECDSDSADLNATIWEYLADNNRRHELSI